MVVERGDRTKRFTSAAAACDSDPHACTQPASPPPTRHPRPGPERQQAAGGRRRGGLGLHRGHGGAAAAVVAPHGRGLLPQGPVAGPPEHHLRHRMGKGGRARARHAAACGLQVTCSCLRRMLSHAPWLTPMQRATAAPLPERLPPVHGRGRPPRRRLGHAHRRAALLLQGPRRQRQGGRVARGPARRPGLGRARWRRARVGPARADALVGAAAARDTGAGADHPRGGRRRWRRRRGRGREGRRRGARAAAAQRDGAGVPAERKLAGGGGRHGRRRARVGRAHAAAGAGWRDAAARGDGRRRRCRGGGHGRERDPDADRPRRARQRRRQARHARQRRHRRQGARPRRGRRRTPALAARRVPPPRAPAARDHVPRALPPGRRAPRLDQRRRAPPLPDARPGPRGAVCNAGRPPRRELLRQGRVQRRRARGGQRVERRRGAHLEREPRSWLWGCSCVYCVRLLRLASKTHTDYTPLPP
jgi:hypothetical protein